MIPPFSEAYVNRLLSWDSAITHLLEGMCSCPIWFKTVDIDARTNEHVAFCPTCKTKKQIVPPEPEEQILAREERDRKFLEGMAILGRAAGERINKILLDALK